MNDGSGWKSIESGGQAVQRQAYELAASLNPEAAARSTSMGEQQIMGFNHAAAGYSSAQEMLRAFRSEDEQDKAYMRFVMGNPALVKAIKDKDFTAIARIFNGGGNVTNYASALKAAYDRLRQ